MSPKPDQRLRLARSAAAKELKLPADDWRVKRTAILHIAHENMTDALISGARIDIGDLLKIEDALQAIRASVPVPPITVNLEIVEREGSEKEIEAEAIETKPADKPPIDTKPEVEASTPAPTPAPAPPPPAPIRNPSMAAWERAHGRVGRAPDGSEGRSMGGGAGSLCWFTSKSAGQPLGVAADPHPYRNSWGGDRNVGHSLPYPANTKG